MAWTSSGDYLNLTEKEKIIFKLEEACNLSDGSCRVLRQLRIIDLEKLFSEIDKALNDSYQQGKAGKTQ